MRYLGVTYENSVKRNHTILTIKLQRNPNTNNGHPDGQVIHMVIVQLTNQFGNRINQIINHHIRNQFINNQQENQLPRYEIKKTPIRH